MEGCGLTTKNRLSEQAMLGEATRMSGSFVSPAGVSGWRLVTRRRGTLTPTSRGERFFDDLLKCIIDDVSALCSFYKPTAESLRSLKSPESITKFAFFPIQTPQFSFNINVCNSKAARWDVLLTET